MLDIRWLVPGRGVIVTAVVASQNLRSSKSLYMAINSVFEARDCVSC